MCAPSIAAYRARIGLFQARFVHVRAANSKNGTKRNLLFYGLLLSIILVIGGVELNPGPGITLDDIWEKLNGFEVLKEDVRTMKGDIKQFTEIIGRVENEMESLKTDYMKLAEENKVLLAKVDRLEGFSRRQNLVFYNIPENNAETWEMSEAKVRDLVNHTLETALNDMDIERAHRVGQPGNYNRPIVVKFSNYKLKMNILMQSNKLKGTSYGIAEDYTERVRQTRSELKGYMLYAKQKNCRAMLRFDKLVVDGKYYSLEELVENKYPKVEETRRRRRQQSASPLVKYKKQKMMGQGAVTEVDGSNSDSLQQLIPGQSQDNRQLGTITETTASAAIPSVEELDTSDSERSRQQQVAQKPAATLDGWLTSPWQPSSSGYNTRAKSTQKSKDRQTEK